MGLLLACLWLCVTPLPKGQETRILEGDPVALTCKLVKEVSERSGRRRLWIEVSNPGEHAAEPLEFRIEHRPKRAKMKQADAEPQIEIEARAAFPFADRRGRPVPARGKLRYWIPSYTTQDEATLSITVSRACFFDLASNAEPAAPSLVIGKLAQVQQTGMNGEPLQVSRVKIENPLASPLDVIFLATVSEPRNEQLLLGARLAPGANDWIISGLTSALCFEYDTPSQAVHVDKLELVDWCRVLEPDPALAAKKFAAAFRDWLRWSEPFPAVAGSVNCSVQSSSGPGQPLLEYVVAGTFSLDSAGKASLDLDPARHPKIPAETLRGLATTGARKIESAFADLRRANFEALSSSSKLRLVAADTVEIEGAGFAPANTPLAPPDAAKRDPRQTPNFTLREGRIVADGDRSDLRRYLWSTRDLGAGYVVSERRSPAGDWCYQYAYGILDGAPVPGIYREYWGTQQGDLLSQFQVQFHDLRFVRDAAANAPAAASGAGVEALRAAWESGYRYPRDERELRFAFEVRQPGTDLSWQGLRELDGRARLGNFRGFLMGASGWGEFNAEFQTTMTDGQRSGLAFVLYDRLIMWAGRDFNGREDFATQFAGCEIDSMSADGSFTIRGGVIERIWVKDGSVVTLRWRGGMERRLSWSKLGDQRLVTRVNSGGEELNAKFTSVNGVLLPTEFDFQHVFGPDWGPEHIRLRELSLR